MSSTREDILDALVTDVQAITEITQATRYIKSFDLAVRDVPYVGIVAGDEVPIVEDATNIDSYLPVRMFLITEQQYQGVETLIGKIKDALIGSATCPKSLDVNIQLLQIDSIEPVMLEDLDEQAFSSVVINLTIRYYSAKAGF